MHNLYKKYEQHVKEPQEAGRMTNMWRLNNMLLKNY